MGNRARHQGIALGGKEHADAAEKIDEHDQAVRCLPDISDDGQGRHRRDVAQSVDDEIPIAKFAAQYAGRWRSCALEREATLGLRIAQQALPNPSKNARAFASRLSM